jgi:hypothetical protein
MNLPDSFYLALCMTVLLVGAVYWVWTQIQYVQRKVNVLDNIVYELKTLCSSQKPPEVYLGAPTQPVPQYPPAPSSVIDEEDILHETLHTEELAAAPAIAEYVETEAIPAMGGADVDVTDVIDAIDATLDTKEEAEKIEEGLPAFHDEDAGSVDLQPGGVGSGVKSVSLSSSLDSMTLKELRRLGKQKGVTGAEDMRKKELITALRATPIDSFLEAQ